MLPAREQIMEMEAPRVVIYARSSPARAKDALRQQVLLRNLAEHRGYTVVGEFIEHTQSADSDRPILDQALNALRERRADAIFAEYSDRLADGLGFRFLLQLVDVLDGQIITAMQ